jgi:MBG domain (YGX type)
VTADAKEKVYGAADPALTYQITSGSLASGDAFSGALVREAGDNVGAYAIKQGTLALSNNYALTYAGGSLTISKASVTVKADNATRLYGAANPNFTGTITGIQNADSITASYGSSADAASAVGSYPIVPTLSDGGNNKLSNYNVTVTNGTLTISKASLTVKANDASRVYGAVNSSFAGTITGIQNGDNITASYASSASATSAVGTYAIVPTLSDSGSDKLCNYIVSSTNGTLTVTQATLTVTPDSSKSKTYGSMFSTFSGTTAGLHNGDTVAVNYTSPGAPATAAVATYDITVATVTFTQGSASNYNVVKNTATNGLTVNPATLTITPDGSKSKILGATFTAFTGTNTGRQNNDNIDVSYNSPGAPASAAAGTYDITVASITFTSGSASNYTIIKNTATKGLTVSYNACLLYDPTRAVKGGATYPIKLYLCDANNVDVSSPGVVLNATAISLIGGNAGTVEDAGNANPDSNFRYDATQGPSGGYIFNLKTSGLRTGSYNLTFTAGGASTSYSAGFGVK